MSGTPKRRVTAAPVTIAPGVLDSGEYHVIYTNALLDHGDDRLGAAAAYLHAAVEFRRRAVVDARAAGRTWAEIGAALGVTKQAAHEMYRTRVKSGGGL